MNYLAIGLGFIIVVILYYVYYYFTNNTLTSGLQPLKTPLTVNYDKLKNPNSLTYSYQVWIYISKPTATTTQIFYRGEIANSEFEVDISGQNLVLKAGQGSTGSPPVQIMSITNEFPFQKWVYLVIYVYNLKTFEAYINGKLAKTVNISTDIKPTSNLSSLNIGNAGLDGYVTKFTRLPTTLDAKTIWQNYLNGNGLSNFFSTLIPYGLNMSISNGEDIVRVVNVF